MEVLIVGGDGPIGRSLAESLGDRALATTRRRAIASTTRPFLDLADPDCAADSLPSAGAVVVAAAMSNFAECRENPDLARQINVLSPERLAAQWIARGAHVVLLSTAAVLDCQEPHMRADRPRAPHSFYGRFKAEAEERLLALGSGVSVLRLTKVLTPDMPLFVNWINALKRGEPITAFADHSFTPLSLPDVVGAIEAVTLDRAGGVYQASGARDISYVNAARHVARRLGADLARVEANSIADRGIARADAPPFTSMDASRLESLGSWRAPEPESVIDAVYGL